MYFTAVHFMGVYFTGMHLTEDFDLSLSVPISCRSPMPPKQRLYYVLEVYEDASPSGDPSGIDLRQLNLTRAQA